MIKISIPRLVGGVPAAYFAAGENKNEKWNY
jgi:hypothetical protein